MTLINCPECGGKVSDKAESCPHCGLPSMYFLSKSNPNQKTKPETVKETPRLLASFQGKLLHEGDLCPLCNSDIRPYSQLTFGIVPWYFKMHRACLNLTVLSMHVPT